VKKDAFVAEARAMLIRRKKRELFFNTAFLGEPAWEVLLMLYAVGGSDCGYAVDDIVESINAPKSVTGRWLSFLERDGLIEFQAGKDQGAALIRLTHIGQTKLDTYFGCGI
jgi:DNA-binding MarR family transcriptional regulator